MRRRSTRALIELEILRRSFLDFPWAPESKNKHCTQTLGTPPKTNPFLCRAVETLREPRSAEHSDAPPDARELWPDMGACGSRLWQR